MGQQQLLLVILVTIIVGIATVVAINTFGSAADSANLDAVRQDIAQIASSAQGYYMKPKMLGGGGNSFVGITMDDIAFSASSTSSSTDQQSGSTTMTASNENGTYQITDPTATSFTIVATPASQSAETANDASSSGETISAYVGPSCLQIGDLGGTAPTACN